MVFRRKDTTRFYFSARTETGWEQRPTGTPNRTLAQKIEGMWERLASEYRAWDILNRVRSGEVTIGRLWDLWSETKQNVAEVRRLLDDVDLEPYVEQWKTVYQQQRPKNVDKTLVRLRWLIPADAELPRSTVTTAWLTSKLYAYPGKPATLRAVHSAWSVFFDYVTRVHQLFPASPMLLVDKPSPANPIVQFYEIETAQRIVDAQPDAQRRAFYALAYGAAIESGVSLRLTRADLYPASKEVNAAGTKTHTRHRVARVSDWAWPIVWKYAKTLLPHARLFPEEWDSPKVSAWHAATLRDLKLEPKLRLHCARHHWAVRHLRAGVPIAVVQHQLGHSTPIITLKTYGAFIPQGDDRARWEQQVAEDTKRRQQAN